MVLVSLLRYLLRAANRSRLPRPNKECRGSQPTLDSAAPFAAQRFGSHSGFLVYHLQYLGHRDLDRPDFILFVIPTSIRG